jgi:subtilisin family serine protease
VTATALAAALRLSPAGLKAAATAPVDVAILDSGIDATHPDLAGRVVRAVSIEDGALQERDPAGANDVLGHGTAVGGIVAGIAPNARLIDIRVLRGDRLGTGTDLLAGLRLAVEARWRVLNLSLATPARFAPELGRLCERAFYQDQVVAAARRNFPVSDEGLPAEFAACIGVDTGRALRAPQIRYSAGRSIEMEAAGDAVQVAASGGGYTTMTGTSFATPVVSGVCALLLGAFPTLHTIELRAILAAWGTMAGWSATEETGR